MPELRTRGASIAAALETLPEGERPSDLLKRVAALEIALAGMQDAETAPPAQEEPVEEPTAQDPPAESEPVEDTEPAPTNPNDPVEPPEDPALAGETDTGDTAADPIEPEDPPTDDTTT